MENVHLFTAVIPEHSG